MSSGSAKPTVSGRLIVVAPAVGHGVGHLDQEVEIAARGVLGRELDVVAERPRQLHRRDRPLEAFLAGDAQLGRQMQIGGGEEHVDARMGRAAHGVPGRDHVLGHGPGQGGDGRRCAPRG